MIEGNRLKFGYGDICVSAHSILGYMTFQQFVPPSNCGDKVEREVEFVGECIKIPVNCDGYDELSNWLYEVENHIIDSFEFKGYIFDFSNYNKESIRVCKKYAYRAISGYLLSLAA